MTTPVRVMTPLGPATVVCRALTRARESGYFVSFSRRDYTTERWAEMTHGGPCMYKVYAAGEVQIVEEGKDGAK